VLTCTDKTVPTITDNLLIGTYFNLSNSTAISRVAYDPEKYLTFSISDGKLGFYRWSGQYLTPAKAYLDKTKMPDEAKALRAFSLKFVPAQETEDDVVVSEDGGFVDGVKSVTTRQQDHAIYDLMGHRMVGYDVSSLPRGIYIVNGKKVVVK
jgi:hypothetical protein